MPRRRTVDHADPTPLTDQLADVIRGQIESGEVASGTSLPGERALSDSHSVSRVTVRRALLRLADEKLITSLPKRSWIVR